MTPRISIITAFYNDAKFIPNLQASLFSQSFKKWEWIIVDDGSDFDNLNILKRIEISDPRIQVTPRPKGKTKGPSACRNHGLRLAKGEYIIFMDSDDHFSETALNDRLRSMTQSPPSEGEVLYFETVGVQDETHRRLLWDDPNHPMEWLESILYRLPPCQTAGPFWPRETIQKLGGWNEEVRMWDDIELHSRAHMFGVNFRKARFSSPNVLYLIRQSSLSHSEFHSSKEIESRISALFSIVRNAELYEFSPKQEEALASMIFAVSREILERRDFSRYRQIRKMLSPSLKPVQISALNRLCTYRRFRLDKLPIPSARKKLNRAVNEAFPSPERSILSHPFLDNWPCVTLVMLTFNGMGWLRDSYHTFLEQDYAGEWEWLVIDSGSTDGTVEFLQRFDRVRIHQIPNAEFGHGKTRNLACELSPNELLLYTVQDACPRSKSWMTNMVADLEHHALDAVCGGQAVQPHPNNNPVQWYKPVSEPNVVNIVTAEAFKAMDIQLQIKACGWDDVNALYRRSSLIETPFRNVVFAEDMQWAKERLSSNVARIGYAHANKVWHHHRHATGYTRERVLSNLYSISTIFNTNPVDDSPPTRSLSSLQRLRLIVLRTGLCRLRQIIHWWRYNAQWTSEKNKAQRDFSKAFSMGPEYVHTLCEHVTQHAPQSKHQDS